MWEWVIPAGTFILLHQLPGLFIIGSNLLSSKSDPLYHSQPKIEKNAQLCLMRENMLLATVLDSVCISNYRSVCGKDIVIGKICALNNFFFQDLP